MSDEPDQGAPLGSLEWWDEHERRLQRRRPRADGLTVERVIEAAVRIVDDDGLDALTMRRLADELSTASASLYRHVTGRDELLTIVVDHVIGAVPFPPDHLDGRAKVEHLAFGLRTVLLAHPNLLAALVGGPLLGPNARRGTDHAVACLVEAGHDPSEAVPAYLALVDYVLGSVYFGSARARPRRDDPTADDVFGFGLRAILDGLERRSGPGAPAADQTRERRSH